MRYIDTIIIHCSYTMPSMDIGAEEIRDWHVNDNGWNDIGYHYVSRRNGDIEKGRDDSVIGAHARGANKSSIGVCLIGGRAENGGNEDNFTNDQFIALAGLIGDLEWQFGDVEVIGHYDVPDSGKTCPNFNVQEWLESIK